MMCIRFVALILFAGISACVGSNSIVATESAAVTADPNPGTCSATKYAVGDDPLVPFKCRLDQDNCNQGYAPSYPSNPGTFGACDCTCEAVADDSTSTAH